MLDIGIGLDELAMVAVVALLVVGPRDLPALMRKVGRYVGKARGMTRHMRAGFDTMMREAEIEEMNKRWERENADIMERARFDTYLDVSDGPPAAPAFVPPEPENSRIVPAAPAPSPSPAPAPSPAPPAAAPLPDARP